MALGRHAAQSFLEGGLGDLPLPALPSLQYR